MYVHEAELIKLRKLWDRLEHYWWTREKTDAYARALPALSRLMRDEPAVFSVYWLLSGAPQASSMSQAFVHNSLLCLAQAKDIAKIEVKGYTLAEWIPLMTPGEFAVWFGRHRPYCTNWKCVGYATPDHFYRAIKKAVAKLGECA